MDFTYKIDGLADLDAKLAELPRAVAGRALQQALSNAARPIVDEGRRRAPVRKDAGAKRLSARKGRLPGFLRASMRRAKGRGADASASVLIGPGKKAFYGMFQEFGTSRQPARPFLRPAFDAALPEAMARLREDLAKAIDRAVKRLGR